MHYNKRVNSITKSRGKVQLPTINKTITAISEHNPSSLVTKANSSFFQKSISYQEKLQWLLKPRLYQKMDFKQIQSEYKQLRKQLFALNDQVGHFLNKVDKKYSKKRMITMEPQKIQQVREKQIENNQFIIDRMLDQYTKLRNKCQTLQPKQSLQQKIQNAKSQIKSMKEKLNQMKLKNKKLGNKIMDTDQLFVDIHECERELDTWNKRKTTMQNKLAQIQRQQTKIAENFSTIDQKSLNADQFWVSQHCKQQKNEIQQKNEASYNQKNSIMEALKRSLHSICQLKQQKYHQILKQLQETHKKISYLQQKTPQSEIKNIEAKQERQKLQIKYRQIERARRQKQKNSSNYAQTQSIEFNKQQRASKIKFNTIVHKSTPSNKNSTLNAFQNKKHTTQTKHTYSNQTQIKQSKTLMAKPLVRVQKNSMKISKFTVSQGIGTSQIDNQSDTIEVDQILPKKQTDVIQSKLQARQENKDIIIAENKQSKKSDSKQSQINAQKKQYNQELINNRKSPSNIISNAPQVDEQLNSFSRRKLVSQNIQQKKGKQGSRYQIQSQYNHKNNEQMHEFNKQVIKSRQLISATQKKVKQAENHSQKQDSSYKFDIDLTNVKKNMQDIAKKQKQKKFSSRMAVVKVQPAQQERESSQET